MLKKFKSLSVVVGVILTGALVGAQASQSPIKKVKEQVIFSQDVKVGETVLKAGRYEVSSNDQGLTFKKMVQDVAYTDLWIFDYKEKPVTVKATATLLDAKSRGTQLDMPADAAGVRVLKSIVLDDTNVRFTFAQ